MPALHTAHLPACLCPETADPEVRPATPQQQVGSCKGQQDPELPLVSLAGLLTLFFIPVELKLVLILLRVSPNSWCAEKTLSWLLLPSDRCQDIKISSFESKKPNASCKQRKA